MNETNRTDGEVMKVPTPVPLKEDRQRYLDRANGMIACGHIVGGPMGAMIHQLLAALDHVEAERDVLSRQNDDFVETVNNLAEENARLKASIKEARAKLQQSETPFYEGCEIINKLIGD